MLFESPRPLLTAGVLALSAFLVSLAAQNSNVRRAFEVGVATLAEMPALSFVHKSLSMVPGWVEAGLAVVGLVVGCAFRLRHWHHSASVSAAALHPTPSVTPASPAVETLPASETRHVLVVTPRIQVNQMPLNACPDRPLAANVSVVVTIQTYLKSGDYKSSD